MDLKDFKKEFDLVDISIKIKDEKYIDSLITSLVRQGYLVYMDKNEHGEFEVIFNISTKDIYYSSLG